MNTSNKVTVVLAEDHRLMAEGMESLLEGHCRVLASVESAAGLARAARELSPDVLIMDVDLNGQDGIRVWDSLRKEGCTSRAIFVTMNTDPECWRRAVSAGAMGYVLKTAAAVDLRAAVQAAAEGRTFVSGFKPNAFEAALNLPSPNTVKEDSLTPRQLDVLRELAKGLAAKEIATALGISQRTVEYHKYQMMQVAGVGSSTALVLWAIKNGLVETR